MTELRPPTADDLPVIAALIRASEAHDRLPRVYSDDEMREDFESSDTEMRVAVRDGVIVGFASNFHPPAPDRLDRAQLSGEVAPEHRGTGIGRALMEWSVTRAVENFAARDHELPRYMRANASDWLGDRHGGYQPVGFET